MIICCVPHLRMGPERDASSQILYKYIKEIFSFHGLRCILDKKQHAGFVLSFC